MAELSRDPITMAEAEIRFVQPYQARKFYECPRCNSDIPPRTGHYVVIPLKQPELRRHWHRACLEWEWKHNLNL